ncbi:MAG: hypothetical protein JRD89_19155 [Deltaproteobacteria bacterium]|nr:hypothetical protein [Deltaproteobacteria bacterium]
MGTASIIEAGTTRKYTPSKSPEGEPEQAVPREGEDRHQEHQPPLEGDQTPPGEAREEQGDAHQGQGEVEPEAPAVDPHPEVDREVENLGPDPAHRT